MIAGKGTCAVSEMLNYSKLSTAEMSKDNTLNKALNNEQTVPIQILPTLPEGLLNVHIDGDVAQTTRFEASNLIKNYMFSHIDKTTDQVPQIIPNHYTTISPYLTIIPNSRRMRFLQPEEKIMEFTLYDRNAPDIIENKHNAMCDKILCRETIKGMPSPYTNMPCIKLYVLSKEIQDRVHRICTSPYAKLEAAAGIYQSIADVQGLVISLKRVGPPAFYNKCPWEKPSFPLLKNYKSLQIDPMDYSQTQKIIIGCTNKYTIQEMIEPDPTLIMGQKCGQHRLAKPTTYPKGAKNQPDWPSIEEAENEEHLSMFWPLLTASFKITCPLCKSQKIQANMPSITDHIFEHHREYTVYKARVVCPTCYTVLNNDTEPDSYIHHVEQKHTIYESFNTLLTPTGLGIRSKVTSASYLIARTSIRSYMQNSLTTYLSHTQTEIEDKTYYMSSTETIQFTDPNTEERSSINCKIHLPRQVIKMTPSIQQHDEIMTLTGDFVQKLYIDKDTGFNSDYTLNDALHDDDIESLLSPLHNVIENMPSNSTDNPTHGLNINSPDSHLLDSIDNNVMDTL